MFSNIVGKLNDLRGDPQISNRLIDMLIDVLGQCAQKLEHRGQVLINGDGGTFPCVPGDTPYDEVYAALTARNTAGSYTASTDEICSGWALLVDGPTKLGDMNIAGDTFISGDQYIEGDIYIDGEITAGELVRFTLNADMAANKAAADILELDGVDTNVYADVHDKAGLFTRALNGAKGLAVKVGAEYHVIDCETKAGAIHFVLTADMSAKTATSTTTDYWGTQQDVQNPGNQTVHDDSNKFARALNGANGIAIYDAIEDNYKVVECEVEATMYFGLQVGALLTSDTTNGVDNLEAMNGDATTASSITANNRLGWAGDDNAKTYIGWNEANSDWDMIQVECPA